MSKSASNMVGKKLLGPRAIITLCSGALISLCVGVGGFARGMATIVGGRSGIERIEARLSWLHETTNQVHQDLDEFRRESDSVREKVEGIGDDIDRANDRIKDFKLVLPKQVFPAE